MEYSIINYRGHYAIINEHGIVQLECDTYREAKEELELLEEG